MYVNEETKQNRRAACMGCDFYRGHFKILGFTIFKRVPQCKVCKCSIILKTMFEDTNCPKNKW